MIAAAMLPGGRGARQRATESPAGPSDPDDATAAGRGTVALLVAARDEETALPAMLAAFERLEMSERCVEYVLIDDGSHDDTQAILRAWAAGREQVQIAAWPRSIGKAAALNEGLRLAPGADLVAVYDADLRPEPASLSALCAPFADPRVGAVCGRREPIDPARSGPARYAALELWVHQLVTQAGKDRLGWNPTTMGGHCVYRRSALDAIGGFPPRSFSEDIEVSLALVAAGWRTRFIESAIAHGEMVSTFSRYWNQRTRWTLGLYGSSRRARGIEAWLVAAGYTDRLVLLAAAAAAVLRVMHPGWLALYFAPPALAIVCALARARVLRDAPAYLAWCAPMFVVDVAATVAATIKGVLRRKPNWQTGSG
jgi:cellulose synthase/poly-beta-1,6-N-acetylglucosamine synthase-like glycosyltransferase